MNPLAALMVLALLLGACQTPVRPDLETEAHTRTVEEPVPEEAPAGQRYRVETERSDIRIITYPDGRMGHPHVMGGEVLSGEIVLPEDHHAVWLDLAIKVDALEVDQASWREDEGFDPDMSDRAIAGTRENMLSEDVLHAQPYPEIRIRASSALGPLWQPDIKAQFTLRGETRELTVPVAVDRTDEVLEVTGRFRIYQTEFGIEPFSAVGGALRIADEVLIRFRIRARLSGEAE